MSTKIKNFIKSCTYHKKDFRICKSFEKQVKLTCTEKLHHNDFNKFQFQLRTNYTQCLLENLNKITAQHTQYITYWKHILLDLIFVIVCENVVK